MIGRGRYMRSTITMSVKPILLGGSFETIKTATLLFLRYSLCSCVFVQKTTFISRFVPFILCRALPNQNDRFLLMSLEHHTQEYGESTYLLIPCTNIHRRFVERNLETLEKRFIIRYPEEILAKRKLFPITAKGKDL